MEKKVKRHTLVPKSCSRCGNDLMTGKSIFHLPFEERYIVFCEVCHDGLHFPSNLYMQEVVTDEKWKKFWEEEVDGK